MKHIPIVIGCLLLGAAAGAALATASMHHAMTTKEFLSKRDECNRAGLTINWQDWVTSPLGIAGAWCAPSSTQTFTR